MDYSRNLKSLVAGVFLVSLSAASSLADNNTALVRQVSPFGTASGNTLSIDQSAATNARLVGPGANLVGSVAAQTLAVLSGQAGSDPSALQKGESNTATAVMSGSGGELQLFQATPSLNNVGGGNQAEMVAANAALGGVIQIGEFNTAALTLDDGRGLVSQTGNQNWASLTVNGSTSQASLSQVGDFNNGAMIVGSGGSATLLQIGDGNRSGNVEVGNGATLIYTQIGNGIQPTRDALSIMSDADGPVLITQIAF